MIFVTSAAWNSHLKSIHKTSIASQPEWCKTNVDMMNIHAPKTLMLGWKDILIFHLSLHNFPTVYCVSSTFMPILKQYHWLVSRSGQNMWLKHTTQFRAQKNSDIVDLFFNKLTNDVCFLALDKSHGWGWHSFNFFSSTYFASNFKSRLTINFMILTAEVNWLLHTWDSHFNRVV